MTEKHYGGDSGINNLGKTTKQANSEASFSLTKKTQSEKKESDSNIDIKNLKKAGEIASEAKKYAKSIVKKDELLLNIAEKIESKIRELGGKPAFPVNLSINEVAAHYTPSFDDKTKANGLLKVDLGVHIDGFAADTALTIDLENSEENKNLIKAAESALAEAAKTIKLNSSLSEVGRVIEKTIKKENFQPIQNLSGHSIDRYDLHAGVTIPNYDNSSNQLLETGVYAVEPFSTNGLGAVKDGKPSGIYHLKKSGNVRDSFAREVLEYIEEEYSTLPFCSRWIHKKFGSRGLLALRQIEQAGILYQYPELIEKGSGKVAQAEHTIILTEKEKIITTL